MEEGIANAGLCDDIKKRQKVKTWWIYKGASCTSDDVLSELFRTKRYSSSLYVKDPPITHSRSMTVTVQPQPHWFSWDVTLSA